jgi:hypothetical protein
MFNFQFPAPCCIFRLKIGWKRVKLDDESTHGGARFYLAFLIG